MSRVVLLVGSLSLTLASLLVMARSEPEVMGVHADLLATALLAAAVGGLTLLVLMWAARGPGSVQERTTYRQPGTRQRVRAGRPR